MDLRKVEENEGVVTSTLGGDGGKCEVDSSRALQSFLDHIPIDTIPGIRNSSPVLEIKSDDCVQDAISLLYDKNVSGAPIVGNVNSDLKEFVDRDIGFIEFSSMVLWCLEEFDKVKVESKNNYLGFLSVLEQTSKIGRTKIGELAKSFLWEPFFPVQAADSLFHVLMLFSKHHRLKIVPVVESSNSCVIGFITQSAVLQLLLQSSGLEWFDQIAEKALREFGFMNAGGFVHVFADQSLADALHVLWEKQIDRVAVVERKTATLMGCVRCSEVYLLLEDESIFNSRKIRELMGNTCNFRCLTIDEFIKKSNAVRSDPGTNSSAEKARASIGALCLKNEFLPQMGTPTTNRKTDTLKQAMENLVASGSDCTFLVNQSGQLEGVVTLGDIISEFSPPCMDSRIDGGGFFKSALEQAGCHVEDGMMIRKH
ncbi:SNF1-related protein kinase regulatory subunit gamma-1-like [Phoenix dactylifera]|uniref:SNF1-related protein kinase regulatory subunit gamma-1-like n=1 Tax=Phoenix dactylifera TaxID=42345 RepID=A0A8B8J976_PHODC|nr:SNF1-related protein kinase regulatory subunit gamma-1-like [Phoenix dactylifera]